ncbi:hypothetical protein J4E83_005506 [Alternaria metachromatica]|uniref:uncharacterized protein n=1 Tax=Alternaria metachromatica TaxID=283354 RepID=UPI0020C4D64F|nr:uncharacterized protein J4E83_005506 [Alternaria metachromatica]KAI4619651.1 hypothetical protein J4E83_005506 [Alternaria metachromatica]
MGAWGYCLFQSDHDLDNVGDMGHELGLSKLQEDAHAVAKAQGKTEEEVERSIHYDIYAPCCSDPELIRKHLDSGVLVEMLSKKEAKILKPLTGSTDEGLEYWFSDPCYMYILLSACAMTLGCHLPASCIALLKKIFTEGGLMPDAQRQMHKALFGPDGYKDGEPYDFASKNLLEEVNASFEERLSSGPGYGGLNVVSPGGMFETGMTTSTTSIVVKELRAQFNTPDECGGCGVEHRPKGKNLLTCSKCLNRKYCSVACQKKHWKIHKKVCEPAKKSL